jgi:RNA polymerase sigma factor (sigma-70 family)
MSDTPDPEFLRRLEDAIGNIPRLQREIFMAHRLDDMSYGEIARRTGLTVRQVERQMAKAIYKLDKQLDGRRLNWWERWF